MFKNRIIRTIWNALPGMIMWCIWKERNGRIFRGESSNPDKVWQTVRANLLASVKSMQWHDEDKLIPADESQVGEFWSLNKLQLDELRMRPKPLQPDSPKFWSPPSPLVFKLNFDGASRGNPGPAGFGGLCRDADGKILFVFLGAIGHDSNNSAELEGLLEGMHCLVRSNSFPAIIEGDSRILIQKARRLAYGRVSGQVATSWRLASRLAELRSLIHNHPAVSFSHVRRDANRVADQLANAGVEGELGTHWGPLETFEGAEWINNCRQLAARDQQGGTPLTRTRDVEGMDVSRREHATTINHHDEG